MSGGGTGLMSGGGLSIGSGGRGKSGFEGCSIVMTAMGATSLPSRSADASRCSYCDGVPDGYPSLTMPLFAPLTVVDVSHSCDALNSSR